MHQCHAPACPSTNTQIRPHQLKTHLNPFHLPSSAMISLFVIFLSLYHYFYLISSLSLYPSNTHTRAHTHSLSLSISHTRTHTHTHAHFIFPFFLIAREQQMSWMFLSAAVQKTRKKEGTQKNIKKSRKKYNQN